MKKSNYENKLLKTTDIDKIEEISLDTDNDGVVDTVVVGDAVRGTNGSQVVLDTDKDGKADKKVKGKIISRKKKSSYILTSPKGNVYNVKAENLDAFKSAHGVCDCCWTIK